MNSYSLIIESLWWIHMRHFMTYEFIYDFMYVKNIVKSYLKSCVPRFQMSSLACCPVKHLLLNNFFYLATWSTSCSFTYFEISCQFCQTKCQLLNWLIFQVHILQTKCQLLYQLLGQLLDATECMAMQQWHYLAQLSSTVMSNMRWNTRTCLAQFAVHLVASPLHPSEHYIPRPWHQHLPCNDVLELTVEEGVQHTKGLAKKLVTQALATFVIWVTPACRYSRDPCQASHKLFGDSLKSCQ